MDEERSAGGIIFCGNQVLVLRNYRGEYIFPKGHLEPGESQLQAALREVAEEAGIQPRVIAPVRDTSYRYRLPGGAWRQKRVSWYLMEADDQHLVVDGHEIKWGSFVSVAEARSLLTHALDRELLIEVAALHGQPD